MTFEFTLSTATIINISNTETALIKFFLFSKYGGPPVSSFKQRHSSSLKRKQIIVKAYTNIYTNVSTNNFFFISNNFH